MTANDEPPIVRVAIPQLPTADLSITERFFGELLLGARSYPGPMLRLVTITCFMLLACTQEQQNKMRRDIQNWTGTNGVLEIYSGEKLVKRFLKIDKLSTATGTSDSQPRPYRYGYGVLDENLDGTVNPNERRVYFEFSDYSTSYVFYESPH